MLVGLLGWVRCSRGYPDLAGVSPWRNASPGSSRSPGATRRSSAASWGVGRLLLLLWAPSSLIPIFKMYFVLS